MIFGPSILFDVYVLLGPAAWAGLAISMFAGRKRMMLLRRKPVPLADPPPSVVILIPAKDEEAHISACIESVLKQDYPNFRIVAIDDRSTDRTGAILDELAKDEARLEVLHVPHGALPAGWTGKCHALDMAWKQTTSDWIFFVDSDVKLQPNALSKMMGQAAGRDYDFLSIMTRLECGSEWERLILPLAAGAVSIMYTISMTNNDSRRRNAFANGQAMLVRRSVYDAVGGHAAVKHLITEDVELARLIKSREYKTRLALGSDIASTRMYSSVGQMYRGWGRIYSGISRRRPWRILAAILFLLVCGFSVYPALVQALMSGECGWLIASITHLTLLTGVTACIYRWSGNAMRYALLFPIGAGAVLSLLAFALKWCISGKVEWRGTQYSPIAHRSTAD